MSAEQEVVVDESVESEAKEMGWVDKADFRGDESKWVDANTFVEHGRHVMPILRKNNERLLSDQQAMRQQVNKLTQELEATRGDFTALEEFHNEEIVRRVAETRAGILSKIKAAKQEGDIDSEVELTDQLTKLTAASREDTGEQNADTEDAQALPINPAFNTWASRTPWYSETPRVGGDVPRSLEALAEAYRLAAAQPDLLGKAFFDELDRRITSTGKPGVRKVEGSRGGITQSSANGRTYADLPADAKVQCDKAAKKFVRENGQFKTEAAYRKHFIEQLESQKYFE